MSTLIHPTADVSPKAVIGKGTRVWHHAHVREGAVIGEDCIIGKSVYVDLNARIGNRVKIQNNVSVYQGVTIEDDVFLGPHCTTTNDLFPRAFRSDFKLQPTLIKKGASVGAHATIICGVTLGEYCMVGAGAVVTKDVPPHALVLGIPARVVAFVCKCGLKAGLKEEKDGKAVLECKKCRETFSVPSEDYALLKKRE